MAVKKRNGRERKDEVEYLYASTYGALAGQRR